jgi:hypothetical protein
MKRTLLFVWLILTASLAGQVEHAPTVAQCQADQRLWLSELEAKTHGLPTFDVIIQWENEMNDCMKVDPDNRLQYDRTWNEAEAETVKRLIHFLNRHSLWEQFNKEDAEGKR